ncbi:hypothetical protein [Paludisphaera mucosa]|uniref:Uncharacterized protein n=1 Tax=Paludisphaera mucosa TaxID=3030827 RepID=A0ABT6FKX2_9BACT|nr:hypothetical protein [Paludisphaera mucosa]MDG3008227.1 hypothetical protein [Paludisphaera mucosa]
MISSELKQGDADRLEEIRREKSAKGALRPVKAIVDRPPAPPASEPIREAPAPCAAVSPLHARRRRGRQTGRLDIPAFAVDDVGERLKVKRDRRWKAKEGA